MNVEIEALWARYGPQLSGGDSVDGKIQMHKHHNVPRNFKVILLQVVVTGKIGKAGIRNFKALHC